MRSLTIALVSSKQDWHGGEEQARQLALGLRSRGHTCQILAPQSSDLASRMAAAGLPVSVFPGRGRNMRALWSLRRELRQLRPDVLHYNDAHAVIAAGVASWGLSIPARVAARRVAFPLRCPLQYQVFADRIICVSREVVRICHAGGVSPQRLRLVHDGVEPTRMEAGDRARGRRALNVADDQPLLLMVAGLTAVKGHSDLLSALPAIAARFPQLRLALAGDGPLRHALEQQADGLGVRDRLLFLGYRQDVADLVQACDLFVMPSHSEGLCSSLIDATFARRPIVATTAGGVLDVVGADESGEAVAWLVPPHNPFALGEAIVQALCSPEQSAVRVQRAWERAWRHFTADQAVDNTLDVYREVLERRADRATARR
ncbi:MAG: glycosyltransferase family 4 protein [Planctomycetota bacterium]|nr:glycosyltransferase family 4 protein [Planctomycetota bacterium]